MKNQSLLQLVVDVHKINSIKVNQRQKILCVELGNLEKRPLDLNPQLQSDLEVYFRWKSTEQHYLVCMRWIDATRMYRIVPERLVNNNLKSLDDVSALACMRGSFGWAKENMQFQFCMTREAWQKEATQDRYDTFVCLTSKKSVEPPKNIKPLMPNAQLTTDAHFLLCDTAGGCQVWTPTVDDILANDWIIKV